MIRVHLLRWRPRQPAQRGSLTLAWTSVSAHLASGCGSPILSTPRRLPSGAASQLDLSPPPAGCSSIPASVLSQKSLTHGAGRGQGALPAGPWLLRIAEATAIDLVAPL